jgi:hypothetical protein
MVASRHQQVGRAPSKQADWHGRVLVAEMFGYYGLIGAAAVAAIVLH